MRCPSIHMYVGCQCGLEAGHQGYCVHEAIPEKSPETCTRCVWQSDSVGDFLRHVEYQMIPTELTRVQEAK